MLQDSKHRLLEGLNAIVVAREINDDRKNKEMKVLESNMLLEVNNSNKMRGEIEHNFEQITAQRMAQHRTELERQREQRSAVHADLAQQLQDEVKRIAVVLEEQRVARVESGERIVASLDAEFLKLQEAVV